MNKKLRAAVVKRAGGHCENCCAFAGEAGHAVWLLCPKCDHEKTTNTPSRQVWLERFAIHCALYGYQAEVKLALVKLEALKAKGLAA